MSARRRLGRLTALVAALGVLGPAADAVARPSLWERVRRPLAVEEAQLLSQLERTLDARALSYGEPMMTRDIARGAVARSDLSGIRTPVDPRLACVMAEALVAADVGREREARSLLEGALAVLPPGPLRIEALRRLGGVLAELGEPARAREIHTQGLELESSSRERANSYYNRADASLQLDELEVARADYLRAIELADEPDTLALARYGLAVALERLGDLPAAFVVLDGALGITLPFPAYASPDPLELPGVFFVPAYERYYLEALRSMATLRRATDPGEQQSARALALLAWDAYLAAAPDQVPYRKNAETHRRRLVEGSKRPPVKRR